MARALDVIGDPWTPLVLRDLYLELNRFDQIVTDLGISRHLLATRLEHLVSAGVVERQRYEHHPPRHEYRLTEAGRDLVPVLMALTAWGDRWFTPEAGPPILFEHGCGEVVAPAVACPVCRQQVTVANTTPRPGPGGRVAPGTRLVGGLVAQRPRA